jgi:hypothetical protein
MNSDDVILLVLDRLRAGLDIPVEFKGETDGVDVPGVVVSAEGPRRLSDKHGASTYAGPVLDGFGNETAEEHHVYQSLGLDVVVQTNDRGERADVMEAVAAEFFPYEGQITALHEDLHSLTVGDASSRDLMLREPAQYVYGRVLDFEYLQRFVVDGETLTDIPSSVYPSE